MVPEDVTIGKGKTVTFVVNGPGHGIAIYPVSKNTTREDITAHLCAHDPVTHACTDPSFANANHTIRDGKDNVVIVTGTNPPVQRVDDLTRILNNLVAMRADGWRSDAIATYLAHERADLAVLAMEIDLALHR